MGGNYTVEVAGTPNCGVVTKSFSIINPAATVVNASSLNPKCNNSNDGILIVSATGNGPWTYTWKDHSGTVITTRSATLLTDSLKNLAGGNYSVDVTSTPNCGTITKTYSIVSPAANSVNASSVNPSCNNTANGSLVASPSGNGPWNFVWKDAQGTVVKTTNGSHSADTLKKATEGDYSVNITYPTCGNVSQNYSLAALSSTTANFTPSTDSTATSTTVTFNNNSNGATSYSWSFGDGGTSTLSQPLHAYSSQGKYTVKLVATNGNCTDSSSSKITVFLSTGINNLSTSNAIAILNSTAGTYVNFKLDSPENFSIGLYNLIGQKIMEENRYVSTETIKLDLPEGLNGIYLIRISSVSKSFTQKIYVDNK